MEKYRKTATVALEVNQEQKAKRLDGRADIEHYDRYHSSGEQGSRYNYRTLRRFENWSVLLEPFTDLLLRHHPENSLIFFGGSPSVKAHDMATDAPDILPIRIK